MNYPRIMICDSKVYSRTMLKNILDQINEFIILETENGVELTSSLGASRANGRTFELCFLDIEIKNEDPIRLIKRIKSIDHNIDIVLCGGVKLTDELIGEAINFGVTKFISKPYKFEEVNLILSEN